MPDGVATLRLDASRHLAIRIDAYGLAPGSATTLAVVSGSCLQPGATLLSFAQPISADGRGAAGAEASSDQVAAAGIPHGAAVELRATGGSLLACTDIPNAGAGAPLRLFAPPADKPGGLALLTPTGQTDVTVSVTAVGLHPGTAYTVQLRGGSCQAQGALVRTAITGVSSDATGSARASSTLAGLAPPGSQGWDVVVLAGGGQPVLCGDVGR
jgi:hypothetical protein